jgi:hypothetical protein
VTRKVSVFFFSKLSYVRLNMIESNHDAVLLIANDARARYTGELLLRTRPKIYRQVVRLLGEGWSANKICKWCHVTRETVRAVERREATKISARKNTIAASLADVAMLGSERMVEKIGKASLRDAAIGTRIAVDKMLALTGQMPGVNVNIANIPMPTVEERAERDRAHRALDEIARLLREKNQSANPQG